MMIPSWATVLWVGAMAFGLGIVVGWLQIGALWARADMKAERKRLAAHDRIDQGLADVTDIIDRIDVELKTRRQGLKAMPLLGAGGGGGPRGRGGCGGDQ